MSRMAEAGKVAPTARQLGRRALSLGAASALDYAVQFLLPIVLLVVPFASNAMRNELALFGG